MMKAISHLSCTFAIVLSTTSGFATEPSGTTRKWQTKAGSYSVEATYISQDDAVVKLAKQDGTVVEVVKTRLSAEDNQWLAIAQFEEQDRECDRQCQPLHHGLVNSQASNTAALVALHNQFKQSPIAGMLAAVASAAIDNDPKKSVTLLNESNRRITAQRELVPTAHETTLVSVLNNLAVCELKLARPSPAANYLLTALKESGPNASGAVLHNANLLLEASNVSGSRFQIKSEIASDLRLRASQATSQNAINGYPRLLVFSTLTNYTTANTGASPNPSAGTFNLDISQPQASVSGLEGIVPNHWCLTCSGRGFLPCQNPKCANGVIVVKERTVVGQNHIGAPISADKVNRVRCSVCSGAGGSDCRDCVQGRIQR